MNRARRLASISFALAVTGAMFLSPSAASAQRAVSGAIALEVNGTQVGFLRSAEGGEVKGNVVSDLGSLKKHLGTTKVEDLSLELGPDMNKSIYDWVAMSWKGTSSPASGAVLLVNYDSNVMARREFSSATIGETTIPELDALSKEPGYVKVTLRPQSVRTVKGAGLVSPTLGGKKAWLTSNFKVELPGLDCTKVRKVDGFTVKMNPTQFPDLRLTLPESSAETWIAWKRENEIDHVNLRPHPAEFALYYDA